MDTGYWAEVEEAAVVAVAGEAEAVAGSRSDPVCRGNRTYYSCRWGYLH